ncbi:MAG: hypothetical protein HC902_10575 [Calothrix sp. SM1_5_4]|nr:hypothetical protein [Calothrix sp. SM1_5_4]
MSYSQILWMRTPNHPFFGAFQGLQVSRQYEPPVSDTDLNNPNTRIQFDYEDRTYERQVVDFALTNRLTKKVWNNGNADYLTTAVFRLSQSYDFNEARSTTPHPWSSINALLDVRTGHFETYTTAAYNPYAKITNLSSRVRLMTTPQNFVQVAYTRNTIFDDEYRISENGETRNVSFGGGIVTRYLETSGQIDYAPLSDKIQSWSYLLNIRPPGHCWLIRVEHRQIVGGDPQIKASFNFDFGGEGGRF